LFLKSGGTLVAAAVSCMHGVLRGAQSSLQSIAVPPRGCTVWQVCAQHFRMGLCAQQISNQRPCL